jgi:hypothetical protein
MRRPGPGPGARHPGAPASAHLQLAPQPLLLLEHLRRRRQLLPQPLQLQPLRLVLGHQLHVLGAAAGAGHRRLQRGLEVAHGAQQLRLPCRHLGGAAPPWRRRQLLLLLQLARGSPGGAAARPRSGGLGQLAAQVLQDGVQPGRCSLRRVPLQPQLQQLHLGLQGAALRRACLSGRR